MSDSEKEDNDEEVVDETKEEEKEEEEAEESIEFNYEQWLEELKAVLSGLDFLLHLDRLPKTKKRYGRTQMYGILWNFIKSRDLKDGFKEHRAYTATAFAKLKQKCKKDVLKMMEQNMDSSWDKWNILVDLMVATVKNTMNEVKDAVVQVEGMKRTVAKETQQFAWMAHVMADPEAHVIFNDIKRGPHEVVGPLQHNIGGTKEWYKVKYQAVIDVAKNNIDSYVNEIANESYEYTHPACNEKRERQKPALGIDPKLGVIDDPLVSAAATAAITPGTTSTIKKKRKKGANKSSGSDRRARIRRGSADKDAADEGDESSDDEQTATELGKQYQTSLLALESQSIKEKLKFDKALAIINNPDKYPPAVVQLAIDHMTADFLA